MPINPKSLKNLRPRVPGVEREKLTTTLLPFSKRWLEKEAKNRGVTMGELIDQLIEKENQADDLKATRYF